MITFKHRVKNNILEIKNTQGELTQDINEIKEIGVRFFQHLLSIEGELDTAQMEDILENIPKLMTNEQNWRLTMPFSDLKIKNTFFSMVHHKSLGLDGFPE